MKIAIFDIDDTIVEETRFMLDKAPDFLLKQYNIHVKIRNPNGYDVAEVYGLADYFKSLGDSDQLANEKCKQINQSFWNSNFIKYCMQPIKPGVKETIEMLKEQGFKIIFLSLRGKPSKKRSALNDFSRLWIVPFLTILQLSRGHLKYDVVKLIKTKKEKIEYINSLNPDYVFEDQSDIISNISSKSLIFCIKAAHNSDLVTSEHIIKIENFYPQQIEQIVINKLKGEQQKQKRRPLIQKSIVREKSIKNPVFLRKVLTELTYSFCCMIGIPLAQGVFHPIVKGKENILKTGSITFVGNHRNKLDPVFIGATSGRNIHWGALLRMFQGKENLFSSGKNPIPCYISAAFITAVGAVPIARNTDNNYLRINMESIKMLYQFLAWDGAVGLFPEGTLNRNPDENKILPLKSDRVFKMACDMGSIIQPVSIVWIPKSVIKKYRVIINYGVPINCRNRTIQETLDIWHATINSDIEEANKLINRIDAVEKSNDGNGDKQKEIRRIVTAFIDK